MTGINQNLVLSVDVVLLTLLDTGLHFATTERPHAPFSGKWTLPGGTVDSEKDENAEDTARRILVDRTGLADAHLEQLATFSGRKRDPRGWSASITHYALLASQPGMGGNLVKWRSVDDPGKLPFDHNAMLAAAVERLRSKVVYSSLLVHLMPKRFTLPELHAVYERVRGSSSDISRFRRIVLKSDFLEPVAGQLRGEYRKGQIYRPRKQVGIEMLHTPLD